MGRNKQVNVRFSNEGLDLLDHERGEFSRGEYIRMAIAWAINKGYKPPIKLG